MRYDVAIVGASFAGLAVAAQLRGKQVALVDRKPIGTGQTSACGTLVSTLQALRLEDSILQTHDQVVVHTPRRTFIFPVQEQPFCTFDYAHLCGLLHERSGAEFVLATALGRYGDTVSTSRGALSAEIIVDASGWRSALAGRLRPAAVHRRQLNFGLETTVARGGEGLHFWYDPRDLMAQGIGWAFPSGDRSRIGVGSYRGDTRLLPALERFLAGLEVRREGLHGGYFTHSLGEPVSDGLFFVGDAAGQCLGLTGEGIRPALFFGSHLGFLLRQTLEDDVTMEEAKRAYRRLVTYRKAGYALLCLAQRMLPALPLPVVQAVLAVLSRPSVLRRVLRLHVEAFRLPVVGEPAGGPELYPDGTSGCSSATS